MLRPGETRMSWWTTRQCIQCHIATFPLSLGHIQKLPFTLSHDPRRFNPEGEGDKIHSWAFQSSTTSYFKHLILKMTQSQKRINSQAGWDAEED
jgi:hypothetical protein